MLEIGSELRVRDPAGADAGTYRVQGLRARGGQGYIYALKGVGGRLAVVKVPGPKGLIANEVELRILAALPPHKNLVRLLGLVELQGVECAVLRWAHQNPFVRLNSPEMRLRTKQFRGKAPRTALPASTAIELTQEVLAALEHLHRHGYVHGDIKASNVLVAINETSHHLGNREYFRAIQQRAYSTVLADLGSTRSVEFLRDKGRQGELLAPSEFTPVFAPPEVFTGKGPVDQAVDVYQAGLLLFQLLTGHMPYENHLPPEAQHGLSSELVDLKQAEAKGSLRPYDSALLRQARQHDVVFAEAFATQRLRDCFYEDLGTLLDHATRHEPRKRPTIARLRHEFLRLFEMKPPKRPTKGRPQVSAWNPRWHLTRTNRLSEASRVPDRPTGRVAEPAPRVSGSGLDTRTVGAGGLEGLTTRNLDMSPDAQATQDLDMEAIQREQAAGRTPTTRSVPPPKRQRPSGRVPQVGTREQPQRGPSGRLPRPKAPAPVRDTAAFKRHQAAAAKERSGAPTLPESDSDELRGRRIVLIDDDRLALAVLGRSLRKRGCQVKTFQDPETALEVISRDHPDVAVCDMEMPGLSGLELVKRLSRRLNGLPFPMVMLSSVEEEGILKAAFRLGLRDYMIKPVPEVELAVKLEKAIREHRKDEPEGIPRDLAGYELLDEIRRGEVAVVYRARDQWERSPGPLKTVKVLRPDLLGESEPLLRLRREIDIIAACEHPGIVSLVESGLVGRVLFYVSDTIPERSLGMEMRDGEEPLGAAGVQDLLRDVGEALAHLHERSVLLGDLTPESLGRDAQGRVLIAELGRARVLGNVLRLDEPALTRSRYTAPELFEDPPELDLRADLYSLGVCALELHSGRPALRDRGTGEVDVAALGAGLPASLVGILTRLVAYDPDKRFPHVTGLLSELRRLPR